MNEQKLQNAIETTSFEKMKVLEKEVGFQEAVKDNETNQSIPFFNLGPANDWNKILPVQIKLKIETIFKKEMIELGYL